MVLPELCSLQRAERGVETVEEFGEGLGSVTECEGNEPDSDAIKTVDDVLSNDPGTLACARSTEAVVTGASSNTVAWGIVSRFENVRRRSAVPEAENASDALVSPAECPVDEPSVAGPARMTEHLRQLLIGDSCAFAARVQATGGFGRSPVLAR